MGGMERSDCVIEMGVVWKMPANFWQASFCAVWRF